MLVQEVLIFVAATLIAFAVPGVSRLLRGPVRALRRVARHRRLAVVMVGLVAFGVSAWLSLAVHLPVPYVHDEFSYLLAGDTFAEGRLTNPTHPMWTHFESMQIIHLPSYQSKYPPMQGLFLALGQVLSGLPICGVWISTALACAALCWMLQAYVPAKWALCGALLPVMNYDITIRWGQVYWGGAVAMLGGALLFGALPRVVRRQRIFDAVMLALGLIVLANSRPFEGLCAALPAAVLLLFWTLFGKHAGARRIALNVVLPIVGTLAAGAVATGYYNQQVTGSPLKMPYVAWAEQYSGWKDKAGFGALVDKNATSRINRLSGWRHNDPRYWGHSPARAAELKIRRHWHFYLQFYFTPLLVFLPWVLRNRWMQFSALAGLCVMIAVLTFSARGNTHYGAPASALAFLFVVQGLRQAGASRFLKRPARRTWVRLWVLGYAVLVIFWLRPYMDGPVLAINQWSMQRQRLIERFESRGGKHLVIVRYGRGHAWYDEWVYNRAEIDGADIVWARDEGPEENEELVEYFADRHIWLLEPDSRPPRLVPYRQALEEEPGST